MAHPTPKRFRVAFSFAGEQRHFVAQIAEILAGQWGKKAVLYDKYHEAEFARPNLGVYLPKLYHEQAELIVVVVCQDYERKEWPGLEWRAIFALLKQRRDDEVMLCRFGQVEVADLFSMEGYLDLDDRTPQDAAARILERHAMLGDRPANPNPTGMAPANPSASPISSAPNVPAHSVPAASSPEVIIKFDPNALSRTEPPRIPRELPPAAHEFFGRQTQLDQLTRRLRAGKNTAVVGPAGMGKTALAAQALAAVVGARAENLAASPFPDGLVYLDLYTYHGQAGPAWNTLANRLCGQDFHERLPARERAVEACRARQILVIIEGGEEADGSPGRATITELFGVLSPENRWLLLTRDSTQATAPETVAVKATLSAKDAADLLDFLTANRSLLSALRQSVLDLLEGHPLALTWAGSLLAREEEDPADLVNEWGAAGLPGLRDPRQAERTLEWLFGRSARGLNEAASQTLAAAGLLARAPFPLDAITAALGGPAAGKVSDQTPALALKTLSQRGLLRRLEKDQWEFTHVLGYRFARNEHNSDPTVRERLGKWLHANLMSALPATGESAVSLVRPLQHATALLQADFDQRLWRPLAEDVLYDAHVRLVELGRLGLAQEALSAFAGWLDRFPVEKAAEPAWQRERSVLLNRRGSVLLAQGDLAGALGAYRESLAVRQRLAEADPSNDGWKRDLSVSQERVGNVLRDQGDLAGALGAYRETLAVIQRLAGADPSNAGWQRDLSVSQGKVGDVLRDQGDLAGALGAYRESLAVSQRLAGADPSNAGWQWDLSVSQERIGGVLRAQGDLAGALGAYRESLAGIQRLAGADPSNAGWQRDLSVSHMKVGDVLRDQGDLAGALGAYRESLELIQRLVGADPSNAGWQRDLSVCQEKVGDVLRDQGDLAGALGAYRESLAVRQRLAGADPSNAGWQRDLWVSFWRMAQVAESTNPAEALAWWRQAYEQISATKQRGTLLPGDEKFLELLRKKMQPE